MKMDVNCYSLEQWEWRSARAFGMEQAYEELGTLEAVGDRYGLSRESVRRIFITFLPRYPPDGGPILWQGWPRFINKTTVAKYMMALQVDVLQQQRARETA